MFLLISLKTICALNIGFDFEEVALKASSEIDNINFEINGSILYGFYMLLTNFSSLKSILEHDSQLNLNPIENLDIRNRLKALGHFSALRFFYVAKILPNNYEFTHDQYKFQIIEILKILNNISILIVRNLAHFTKKYLEAVNFYDMNKKDFFPRYYKYFYEPAGNFEYFYGSLFINLILISEMCSLEEKELRDFLISETKEHYKGEITAFSETLAIITEKVEFVLNKNPILLFGIGKRYEIVEEYISNKK